MGLIFGSVLPSGGVLVFHNLLRPVSDEKMVPRVCSFFISPHSLSGDLKLALLSPLEAGEASLWLCVFLRH